MGRLGGSILRGPRRTKRDTLLACSFIQERTLVKCHLVKSLEPGCLGEYCFWPGISLEQGQLFIDPEVAHAGDVLHEAGHLISMSQEMRRLCVGRLTTSRHKLSVHGSEEENSRFFECLLKAQLQNPYAGSDALATFWAAMACHDLGLNDELVFANAFEDGGHSYRTFKKSFGTSNKTIYSTAAHHIGMISDVSCTSPRWWDWELRV